MAFVGGTGTAAQQRPVDSPPNIVVIFIDDMGYADLGCFRDGLPDSLGYATPAIDDLARSGRRFTQFIVSSAVCSASRAALLTGVWHARLGIHGAYGPGSREGIAAREVTLAELCRSRGYATACVGKWHLGDRPQFLPLQNGFDEYFGLPYSNDMWPQHPDLVELPAEVRARKQAYPPLPLLDGNSVVDPEVTAEDQQQLAGRYVSRAVDFICRHRSDRFFLYVAPAMVHVPLFASPEFAGRSARGLFGDAMQELDAGVGQIIATLDALGLRDRTLVLLASDNGPWLSYGDHAGSAGIFREGKGTAFEGGVRVPLIVSWPGTIPADTTCRQLVAAVDVWPTICEPIGGQRPPHPLDGSSLWPLLVGTPGAVSPHATVPLYFGGQLRAVRDPRWKLVLPHQSQTLAGDAGGSGGRPAPYHQQPIAQALFDLDHDPAETTDVSAAHPEVVARLLIAAEQWRDELGDQLQKRTGRGVRPPDRAAD